MCSNEQTLSAYIDNELSVVQSSSVRDHLEICSTCRKRVDLFEKLSDQLKVSRIDIDQFVQENLWARLVHSTSTSRGLDFWHKGFVLSPSLMVSLSFVFLAVIGISLFIVIPDRNNMQILSKKTESTFYSEDIPIEIPIDNIENVLAYFNINDEPLEVFIQLPDASDFIIQGEPRFLLKANYIAGR